MKRNTFISILCILMLSMFIFTGCFNETEVDGVALSRVKYQTTETTGTVNSKRYTTKFSCRVRNTTKDVLEFEVVYSAKYGGVFGNTTSESQTIVLQPKEKKDITFSHESGSDQVYAKNISISSVRVVT